MPAIEPFFPDEKAIITPKLREDCKRLLAEVEDEPDLFSQRRLDAVLSYALEAWERGLTELMCDMGAAALFGPAALWTISGFAASQDLDIPPSHGNQFYPAWRVRVRTTLEYIVQVDDGGLQKLRTALSQTSLAKHANAVQVSLEEEQQVCAEPADHEPLDRLMAKVYEHVSESLERARGFIETSTSHITDRWANTCDQIPDLLRRLDLLVPPCELIEPGKQVSQAADLSAIVLACWIERLVSEQEQALGLPKYRRLCRLMLKGIEDSELKREFAAWRTK